MLSMTGYGRAEALIEGRKWIIEIKSLNHRYIEIITRLPNALSSLEVDIKKRTIGVHEVGVEFVEDQLGIDNLYEAANSPLVSYLNNCLKAKELFQRDKDYIVRNGEVLIVDEFTGRVLVGRRYNEGMHQAIEAKENVEIKAENQTLATITLQNYFRLYDKLSGMTGTAETEAAELHEIYKLGVVQIPTNRTMIRQDQSDLIYKTEEAKFLAVVDDLAAARTVVASSADLVAVTRDGDVLAAGIVHGGSASAPSLLEVQAAVDEARSRLEAATHRCERIRFELGTAETTSREAQQRVDAALSRLHESDARMAAVAEQLGQLGSAARSAAAEAERLAASLASATAARDADQQTLDELAARLQAAESVPDEGEPSTEERDRLAEAAVLARQAEVEAQWASFARDNYAKAKAKAKKALKKAKKARAKARLT